MIMHNVLKLALSLAVAIFAALPAAAQNAGATPTYGEVRLASGFVPTPHEIRLQAGGPIDAAEELGPDCMGYIASAPDVNIHYQTSGLPLTFYVESESDTTLIVQAPDRRWFCADDTIGLNPVVHLPQSQSGRYTIWVGTYRHSGNARAVLKVSEVGLD